MGKGFVVGRKKAVGKSETTKCVTVGVARGGRVSCITSLSDSEASRSVMSGSFVVEFALSLSHNIIVLIVFGPNWVKLLSDPNEFKR